MRISFKLYPKQKRTREASISELLTEEKSLPNTYPQGELELLNAQAEAALDYGDLILKTLYDKKLISKSDIKKIAKRFPNCDPSTIKIIER